MPVSRLLRVVPHEAIGLTKELVAVDGRIVLCTVCLQIRFRVAPLIAAEGHILVVMTVGFGTVPGFFRQLHRGGSAMAVRPHEAGSTRGIVAGVAHAAGLDDSRTTHHGAQDQLGPGTLLEAVDLERGLVEVCRLRPHGPYGLPAALEAGGTPIAVARHELAAATLELPLHDETRQEAHGPRQD